MRVLFVSSSSGSRGGGELYLSLLGGALARSGLSVALWASTHSRMDELCGQFAAFGEVFRSHYHNLYDRRLRLFGGSGADRTEIQDVWRKWRPSVVHVNKQNLEDGLDLLEMAQSIEKASVCTIHLTQSARFLGAKLGRLRDWWSMRKIREFHGTYIVVDDARKPELEAIVRNSSQVNVIRNGVTIPTEEELARLREEKRRELGLKPEDFFVIAVGRLWEQKRPMLFLDWARRLRAVGVGDRFCWVGEGHLQHDWDVGAAQLGSWISREGWQTNVRPFLAAADLFLHPARYEGLPFGVLEAMAAGLPCVLAEELCEGNFAQMGEGYFISATEGWEKRLTKADLSSIGKRGRQKIEEEFSLEKMAGEYLSLYHRIASCV